MDKVVYERMWLQEDEHWWFVGRRAIITEIIKRYGQLSDEAHLLEAGCGSGGNLSVLAEFGRVDAFEYDPQAAGRAAERSGLTIPFGALPNDIPFNGQLYDLVGLFDVLEHIEDDTATLAALSERLAESGRIVVTVPAFPWLWSAHDERHHHFRRYTRASMATVAQASGLRVEASFYFNTALFPLAVAARAAKGLVGSDAPDDVTPHPLINSALSHVFAAERHLIGRIPMPVGLSLAAVLTK